MVNGIRDNAETAFPHITTAIALAAVIALGLSAGALLMEGAVLVPYWRSLPAADFLQWYRDNASRLLNFFGPLEIVTAVLVLAAAGLYGARTSPGRGPLGHRRIADRGHPRGISTLLSRRQRQLRSRDHRADAVAGELDRWASRHLGALRDCCLAATCPRPGCRGVSGRCDIRGRGYASPPFRTVAGNEMSRTRTGARVSAMNRNETRTYHRSHDRMVPSPAPS
jgi:hypothetical protein